MIVIIHKRHTGPGRIIEIRSEPFIVSGGLVHALPLVVGHEGVAADLKQKEGERREGREGREGELPVKSRLVHRHPHEPHTNEVKGTRRG